jgi:threonine dehydratase
MLLEGAAGVALAGLKQRASGYRKRKLAVIVCGGNISRQTLKSIL